MSKIFRFVDLFAGIGGFRIGLEALNGVCIASSEIDKTANAIYSVNWADDCDHHNLGDITKIEELPAHDLLVGGVPCQSWSIAGKNRGIEDPRGMLWNDVLRILATSRPTAFIFENVKGLADPRHRASLTYLKESFEEMNYEVHYKVLNSYDYGVPQNRARIFIVGIQRSHLHKPFYWPVPTDHHLRLCNILDDIEVCEEDVPLLPIQRDLFGERVNVGFNKLTPVGSKNKFFILTDIRNGPTSIHSWDIYDDISERDRTICMTILRNRRKPKYGPQDGNPISFDDLSLLIDALQESELQRLVDKKILRQYEDKRYEFFNRKLSGGIDGVYRVYLPSSSFFPTLMASGTLDFVATVNVNGESDQEYKQNFIEQILRPQAYRLLNSAELSRLQGFPPTFQLHSERKKNVKLFGNSVAVPVISAVGRAVQQTGCFDA